MNLIVIEQGLFFFLPSLHSVNVFFPAESPVIVPLVQIRRGADRATSADVRCIMLEATSCSLLLCDSSHVVSVFSPSRLFVFCRCEKSLTPSVLETQHEGYLSPDGRRKGEGRGFLTQPKSTIIFFSLFLLVLDPPLYCFF